MSDDHSYDPRSWQRALGRAYMITFGLLFLALSMLYCTKVAPDAWKQAAAQRPIWLVVAGTCSLLATVLALAWSRCKHIPFFVFFTALLAIVGVLSFDRVLTDAQSVLVGSEDIPSLLTSLRWHGSLALLWVALLVPRLTVRAVLAWFGGMLLVYNVMTWL